MTSWLHRPAKPPAIEREMMGPQRRLLEDALKQAKEIAQRTDLNDEERTDLVKRVENIDVLKSKVAQEEAIAVALKGMPVEASDELAKTGALGMGAAFCASEEFQEAKAHGFRGSSAPFEFKAEPNPVDHTTAGPGLVVAQRMNLWEPLASYPAGVSDLIPSIPTSGNNVTYFTTVSETHTIAMAAEGAEKGNFTLIGAQITDEVEVLAGMAAFTRQMLEDAPFMAGFINSRLTKALKIVEEDQILEGNGSSPQLNSIDNRTTSTLSQGTDTVLDAIYKAADLAYTDGGYEADGVVIKPSDWQPIALSKDGVDRYYGTGPFASAIGDTVWGLRVVKSNVLTASKVFVGAFGSACFMARNGGLVLRTSDSHSDYFKKNKVAVLIEERVALGVPAPLAFVHLTLA